ARDAIASLFGRDALDSRVCDLMSLSEWDGIYDESAPAHASDCYTCSGDSPAYRADHEYARACDVIGHRYCDTDLVCYGCGVQAPSVTPALVVFDGQDSPPFLAYVEEGTWNGFAVACITLADLRAVTLDGGVSLFDSSMDS